MSSMSRRDAQRMQLHPCVWLAVAGGVSIVLLVAGGVLELRSPAVGSAVGPSRPMAHTPVTTVNPLASPGTTRPAEAEMARMVFTRIRRQVPS
jgi:hypothetical protein